jgi:hypothetical protein
MRMERCGLGSSLSGQGEVVGFCEHGNERLDSIKYYELLDREIISFPRRTVLH